MKLFRFIGLCLAAAFAVTPGAVLAAMPQAPGIVLDLAVSAPAPVNDCIQSFDKGTAMLFIAAETGCDAVMAEATGLCLKPIDLAHWRQAIAVLDPVEGITCTMLDPSPPG